MKIGRIVSRQVGVPFALLAIATLLLMVLG